jgi:hypothetical protein
VGGFGLGYTSEPGSTACVKCPTGKRGDSGGICVDCTPGKFQHEEGGSVCDPCELYGNQVAGETDLTGWVSNSSATDCVGCAPGTYKSDNKCKICPAGTYSTFAQDVCLSCTTVGLGYSSEAGSASCSKCPAGTWAEGTTEPICTECPVSKYSSEEGAQLCMECPFQTTAEEPGSTKCDFCPAGKYEQDNACSQCPDGKAREAESSLECTYCTPGKVSGLAKINNGGGTIENGHESCTPCGLNTYNVEGGLDNHCTDCEENKYSGEGSQLCTYCPPGKSGNAASASDTSACVSCEAGM